MGWVRDAAWAVLRGSISWGASMLSYAPERALCPYCMGQRGTPCLETARHFAECPRFDGLWHAAQTFLVSAGMPIVVRRWFVLYGPEAAYFSREQYDVAVWIWAALCAIMVAARRQLWAAQNQVWHQKALVAAYRGLLRQAASAELAAATTWQVPRDQCGGTYGRRQVRSRKAWHTRWSGLAVETSAGLMFHGDDGFDECVTRRLVTEYSPRRAGRRPRRHQPPLR